MNKIFVCIATFSLLSTVLLRLMQSDGLKRFQLAFYDSVVYEECAQSSAGCL
jgi:hypothetical protein